ncbi:hypothetical protein DXG01_012939 [Tephrocybe rancida]|nr:hypothetical protein DXG01_012939 [Tephrocybe rancida]
MHGELVNHAEALKTFRERVFDEGILHDGDTVGTDDETLLRFLRARKFDLAAAKKMLKDCQDWRKTVEGVGIDELYRRIDPFDVRIASLVVALKRSSKCSTPSETRFSNAGRCGSTRYVLV